MKWKFWKKEDYIPRNDIPAQNDKEQSYNVKSRYELLMVIYIEGVALGGMIFFESMVRYWGFLLGMLLTASIIVLLVALVLFLYMWRKVTLTELIGKSSGIDLTAYNMAGKKYQDNFLIADIVPIASKDDMQSVLEAVDEQEITLVEQEESGEQTERLLMPEEKDKLFIVKGEQRKKKPLEEFMVVTKYKMAEHLEFNDTTTNFYVGAISVKKDVPSLALKQIGYYGAFQLPLMRVDSSCVSRSDMELHSANLKQVLQAIEAEDSWQASELKKKIVGLEKTVKSQDHIINDLLNKIEKLKMKHEQIDEVGEDEKKPEKPSAFEKVKDWLERLIFFTIGVLVYWAYIQIFVLGGVP